MPKVTIFLPQTEFTNPQVNNYYLLSKTEDSFVFKPIFSTDLPTTALAIDMPMFSIEIELDNPLSDIVKVIEQHAETCLTNPPLINLTQFQQIEEQRQAMVQRLQQVQSQQTSLFCQAIHQVISTNNELRDYQIKTLVNTATRVYSGHNFCLWIWPNGTRKSHTSIMLAEKMLALKLKIMFIATNRLAAIKIANKFNTEVSSRSKIMNHLQDNIVVCVSASLPDIFRHNKGLEIKQRIIFLDKTHSQTNLDTQYYQQKLQGNIVIAKLATFQPLLNTSQQLCNSSPFQICGHLTINNAAVQGYITPLRAIEIVLPYENSVVKANKHLLQATLFLVTQKVICPVTGTDFYNKPTIVRVWNSDVGNQLYQAIEAFKIANPGQAESIGKVLQIYHMQALNEKQATNFYDNLNKLKDNKIRIVIVGQTCITSITSITSANLALGITTAISSVINLRQFAECLVRKPEGEHQKTLFLDVLYQKGKHDKRLLQVG